MEPKRGGSNSESRHAAKLQSKAPRREGRSKKLANRFGVSSLFRFSTYFSSSARTPEVRSTAATNLEILECNRDPVWILTSKHNFSANIPHLQRKLVGGILLKKEEVAAQAWHVDAIRLYAFDAQAEADTFYAQCGFKRGRAGDLQARSASVS
jgi:hypothetical protein